MKEAMRDIAGCEITVSDASMMSSMTSSNDIQVDISGSDYDLSLIHISEQAAVDTYEQDRTDFDSFASVIRKYVGIRELTPAIVNEFVKKIIVHAPDKSSGHRRQKIEIVWNFIGELEQDAQV